MNIKPKKVKRGCWKRQSKKKTTKDMFEIPSRIFTKLDENLTFDIYHPKQIKLQFINIDYGTFKVFKSSADYLDCIKVVEEKQYRGLRKKFVCLGCNTKADKLYLDSQIRCRTCLGLTYLSSQIHNTKKELSIISSQLRGVIVQRL